MRIIFFGDSFVNGTRDPEYRGWVSVLCAESARVHSDLTCYNLGVRKETSADILTRWESEFIPRSVPDERMVTVFSYGVNDTAIEESGRRVPLESTIENTRKIVEGARGLSDTMVIGPTPLADNDHNDRLMELIASMERCLDDRGVPFCNVFPTLISSPAWMHDVAANDGMHPRSGGFNFLAHLIFNWPAWQRLIRGGEGR
ncbi:MAG: lipase [Spirochaetes bacterium]|nr:lipase [Spirochaetota bacterium]